MAVESFFGQLKLPAWCRNIWLGFGLVVLGAAMTYSLPSFHNLMVHDGVWFFLHPLWGLGFFIIVNHVVFAEQGWSRQLMKPRLIRAFAWVGVFSYSLYLTHELVVMQSWRFGAWRTFPMMNTLLLTVPATLIAAWLFFRFCERPYMRKPPTERGVAERGEVFHPAIEQAEA